MSRSYGLLRGGIALACLVALLAGYADGPALAEDERPDLKIEFVGVPIATDQRDVQLKVTNVSTWWSDETTLSIGTLSSNIPAGQPFQLDNQVKLNVENLDPGQSVTFKYTLAVGCNGHAVRAEVSPGKNYEGVPESDALLANNVVQGAVCSSIAAPQPKPSGPPGGVVTRGDIDTPILTVPKHLQPGDQTHSDWRQSRHLGRHLWDHPAPIRFPAGLCRTGLAGLEDHVGYDHHDSDDCYYALVLQTAVKFDLSDLRTVVYGLNKATLQFDEQIRAQRKEDGEPESLFRGCVNYIGLSTIDPATTRDLYPHEEDVYTDGARSVVVTGQVRSLLANPDYYFGFMFGGFNDGDAEDDGACLSRLSNIRLTLEYGVLGPRP